MISRIRWYHALQAAGLLLAVAAAAGGPVIDLWGEPHTPADDLMNNRVECPRRWGRVPLYGLHKIPDTRPGGPSFVLNGGVVEWLPQNARVGSAGDITNIPEFHDCQRFVNGNYFDSLFAIFASFKLDSITRALWDSVTWRSDKPTVATVTPKGMIVGVDSGTTRIVAISTRDTSRQVHIEVHVGPATTSRTVVLPGPISINIARHDSVQAFSQLVRTTVLSLAAATVYNYGPGYTPLGLQANFSCLYVYTDQTSQLRAKIVHVDQLPQIDDACLNAVDPNAAVGQVLSITRTPTVPGDAPAVARWDFDPSSHHYYIGLQCGDGWCEIGKANEDHGSKSYLLGVAPVSGDRVVRVKGWYDEQILAWKPHPDKPSEPSGVVGTIIPVPNLGTLQGRPAFKRFITVAYAALDTANASPHVVKYFKDKLNMLPVSVVGSGGWDPKRLNRMELCFGSERDCGVQWTTEPASARCPAFGPAPARKTILRWYTRITPAGEPLGAQYRCVTRRDHADAGKQIPVTTRWRWILDDETVWTECTQGCCQTEQG